MTAPTSRLIARAVRRPVSLAQTWRDRALCRRDLPNPHPQEWWDAEGRGRFGEAQAAQAKRVCRTCPVLADCLSSTMEKEGDLLARGPAVIGGLTGEERSQLFLDSREHGAFDAEEARLLALESEDSGVPAAELAEPGVGDVTVRLASRLLGEEVPEVLSGPGAYGTALDRALLYADTIRAELAKGSSLKRISIMLRMGRETVRRAVQVLEAEDAEALDAASQGVAA